MGKEQHRRASKQARTTLDVCNKAFELCSAPEDFAALKKRVTYELRQALRRGDFSLAWSYVRLWRLSSSR
jgi:hypothetical protein